ncbi:hypothetical protein [Ruminococcus sp. 5_1_39BFAA]|uniref:hypothetical protein n=1 Tax=Ruminococcus sp. 5_1_39BFAA TaxID=457412 RepID=UPI003562340B
MKDEMIIRIFTLNDDKRVSAFSVSGIWKEEDLIKRAILDIYVKRGYKANDIYRVIVTSGNETLLLRYVVIMDLKPTVLGIVDIGLDDSNEFDNIMDNFAECWEGMNDHEKELSAKQIVGIKGE